MASESVNSLASTETVYRAHIAWKYETVEFLGLPHLKEEQPLTLAEIYVPLSLTREQNGQERFYVPQALEEHRHLVALGDPGSGKSTLINLLAYSFARIEPTPLAKRLGEHVPIPIILRDYRVSAWTKPEEMLADFIARLDPELRETVTPDWLLSILQEGRGILLIDGLDEVGNKQDREQLQDKVILPLLKRMPESLAVLTSRIVGYDEVPFDDLFTEVWEIDGSESAVVGKLERLRTGYNRLWKCYVAPFNEEEIGQFIVKWYTARESDQRLRALGIDSLQAALNRNDRIKRLAGSPALLTLMALIHRALAELPSGRIKLYDKIVEAYLETIQHYRKLDQFEATLEQMKRWLARVGWEMQLRRTESGQADLLATQTEVLNWLVQAIQEEGRSEAEAWAHSFLDYIARRSGLLLPRGQEQGEERYAFAHLTFQEYFAAWHLRGGLRNFDALASACKARAFDRQWHETLVLLFEMLSEFTGYCDDLAEELLTADLSDQIKRRGSAELFAELLLDDQSGLSLPKQERIAEFALQSACSAFNRNIIGSLRQLPSERFNRLIRDWLVERLKQTPPEQIGEAYFVTAAELQDPSEEWPKIVSSVLKVQSKGWSEEQAWDILASSGSDTEVFSWAVTHLPITAWLEDRGFFLYPDINFADIYHDTLMTIQNRSPFHTLLAQLSAIYSVAHLQILPTLCIAFDGNHFAVVDRFRALVRSRALTQVLAQPQDLALALARDRVRALAQNRVRALVRALARSRALARAVARPQDLALVRTLDRALAGPLNLAKALAFTSQEAIPPWQMECVGLSVEVSFSEWLFSNPAGPAEKLKEHIATLERRLTASDDWTRLLALSSLLLLGEGTPERCAARNALLDHGMEHPEAFTFPAEVQEAVDNAQFRSEFPAILQQIFLHKPHDPWIQPEWFDPENPASRFFRANPRAFAACAAEVLDPKGETDLAQWR